MRVESGAVLWFTGLSGAGKTSLATYVRDQLIKAGHTRIEMLDGDELRTTICKGLGFSHEDRFENVRRVAYLSKLLSRNGVIVLVSAITPYKAMRDHCRSEVPGYTEIYVKRPLALCEANDVKGLYAKARRGEIAQFTGVSDPYEEPTSPDIVVDTSSGDAAENSANILNWLEEHGLLVSVRH